MKGQLQSDRESKDFKVERKLDPNTGEVTATYYWKGKQVPKVTLTGNIAEQASGLALIDKDLKNALKWAKRAKALSANFNVDRELFHEAKDREVFDEIKCLFVASLTFYAKAFTEAHGRRAQMSQSWLEKDFHESHEYYMKYRHNFAAHSGNEKLEYARTYLVMAPGHWTIGTSRLQPDYSEDQDGADKFVNLIEHAISQINVRYTKLASKIVQSAQKESSKTWKKAVEKEISVDIDPIVKKMKG